MRAGKERNLRINQRSKIGEPDALTDSEEQNPSHPRLDKDTLTKNVIRRDPGFLYFFFFFFRKRIISVSFHMDEIKFRGMRWSRVMASSFFFKMWSSTYSSAFSSGNICGGVEFLIVVVLTHSAIMGNSNYEM